MLNRRSFLLGSTAALTLASAACRTAIAPTPLRQRQVVTGLSAPVEIVDDPYGVPHIRAASIPDAFFGQGYVVARDRLFHYRGDLEAELARVPPNILACARAYVAGINARIDEVAQDPTLLPLEYGILGVSPLKWDLMDLVVARSVSIGNADDEVRRARLAGLGLLELDAVIAPLRPAWPLKVPDGLDASAVSEADLGVLRLGRLPFGAVPSPEPNAAAAAAAERANAGSNAWTVGPERSATGRPILANDPHLGIGGFGPRHVAHLSAPGLDVIGGGAPGLPGIMQGQTDRFAFVAVAFRVVRV